MACGTISFIVMLAYHVPSTTVFLQPHNKLVAYALLVCDVQSVSAAHECCILAVDASDDGFCQASVVRLGALAMNRECAYLPST